MCVCVCLFVCTCLRLTSTAWPHTAHTAHCGACTCHSAAGGSMFLSLRWCCSVRKMLSCCSGWSISSCCSNLLGLGPLQGKGWKFWVRHKQSNLLVLPRLKMTSWPTTWKHPSLHSPDETGDIDVCECGHQVLTVKPIHDAAVAGDSACKVLQERRGDVSSNWGSRKK